MAITITVLPAASISVNPVVPATITINPNLPSVGATVNVGTTTTGAPGTYASVVNSGTASAAILDFTIPRGDKGDTGDSGVAYATAPLAYNSGTKTISIDLSAYATQSFVTSQGYITSSALTPYLTSATAAATYYPLTNPSGYITSSALSGYATQSWVTSQGYITSSALSPYLLSATAATTYAPIAAAVPTGGSTGQVLAKSSGSNYSVSWQTPAVGDKYYTTSTTSLSVTNGSKTLTVAAGLSYTTQQDIIIAHDASHHMHAVVTSYNPSTGVLVADVAQHTGSGTYSSWTVNVGGISSVAEWGLITGTLSNQTDLQSALNGKADAAPSNGNYYVAYNGGWEQLIIT